MLQETVVRKYLKTLDQEKLQNAWESFQAHFHNPQIQENNRNSKEFNWEDYFLAENQSRNHQHQITQTDQEIDQMVYELYGLTAEEFAIDENF